MQSQAHTRPGLHLSPFSWFTDSHLKFRPLQEALDSRNQQSPCFSSWILNTKQSPFTIDLTTQHPNLSALVHQCYLDPSLALDSHSLLIGLYIYRLVSSNIFSLFQPHDLFKMENWLSFPPCYLRPSSDIPCVLWTDKMLT